ALAPGDHPEGAQPYKVAPTSCQHRRMIRPPLHAIDAGFASGLLPYRHRGDLRGRWPDPTPLHESVDGVGRSAGRDPHRAIVEVDWLGLNAELSRLSPRRHTVSDTLHAPFYPDHDVRHWGSF